MRLFFSISFGGFHNEYARAEQSVPEEKISLEKIDPMNRLQEGKEEEEEKVCFINKKEPKKKEIDIISDNEKKYLEIIKGSPMEEMVSFIAEKDKDTAAFLVAIAKKESDWGRHAPSRAGKDCYNYWGYKGGYNPVQGYSCFDSPQQAIDVVGGRINDLTKKGLNTPERMIVWKCGSSCSWDRPENVRSWIGAVRTYWSKLI